MVDETIGVPWAPEELPIPTNRLAGWNYVVVEEIVDDTALLRRWSWPTADARGRLVWPHGQEQRTQAAAINVDVLRAQLYQPSGLQRHPRPGDTFAVERSGPGWRRGSVHDLRTLFADGAVYDISAEARYAAKLAYQAGLTRVIPLSTAEPALREGVAGLVQQRTTASAPRLTVAATRSAIPHPRRR